MIGLYAELRVLPEFVLTQRVRKVLGELDEFMFALTSKLSYFSPDIAIFRPGSLSCSIRKYSPKTWSNSLDMLEAGTAAKVSVGYSTTDVMDLEPRGLVFDVGRIGLYLSQSSLPAPIPVEIESRLLTLVREAALATCAVTASLGPYPDADGVEDDGIFISHEIQTSMDRYVLGPAWWTVLTEQHLAVLGGRDEVARSAPCWRTSDLTADGGAVALQLSEHLTGVTAEGTAALRRYLSPLRPAEPTLISTPWPQPPSQDDASFAVDTAGRFDWEGARFALWVRGELGSAEETIRSALSAWATIGLNGAFDGVMHRVDPPFVAPSEDGEWTVVEWSADLGSAGETCLHALESMLRTICELERLAVAKLLVGEGAELNPDDRV